MTAPIRIAAFLAALAAVFAVAFLSTLLQFPSLCGERGLIPAPRVPSSPVLQSSPIKHRERLSRTSLGKRTRSSSPFVLIRAKRTQITPPDTPVTFYPELPEDKVDEGERKLRRSTTEIKALRHRLKTQRSRSSLENGLRDVRRVSYAVSVNAADEDSEDELSFGF